MKKNYKAFRKLVIACLLTTTFYNAFAGQFQVTNTNNTGAGSLADAISQANASPGLDTITFNLPEGFSMTIAPTTALPDITDPLFINGYSQPGAARGPIATRTIRINIDGVNLPAATNIFVVNSVNVEIAGLAIYRASGAGNGITIQNGANNAFIWGNYIGTDSTGLTTTLGNNGNGVVCNFLQGTSNAGIIIGVNSDGNNDTDEGNLISCNGDNGVFLWRTNNSRVSGNIIGFNKNGTGTGFGNGFRIGVNGVLVTANSFNNTIGTNGDGIADNLEVNRIGNNAGRGILIASESDNNVVAGNFVGIDATNANAGNGNSGIEILPGSNNRIGTNGDGISDALERNIVCFNGVDGIRIVGDIFGGFPSSSNNNIIAGNSIGTDAAGTLVAGNVGFGIAILSNNNESVNNNIIGTNEDGNGDDVEGNLIANNSKGIVINNPFGSSTHNGNRISRNSIYNNTQLGIDLSNDGITANDNGDGDTGPNDLMNFPFITRANVQGGALVVSGIAPANSIIEFYIADASGLEGRTYLFTAQEGNTYGPFNITDDSTGTASYNDATYGTGTDQKFGFSIPVVSLPAAVPAGSIIVALAISTSPTVNSTSEFGPNFISTLPVRFVQFNGRVANGVVQLDWTTSQESNNSHFDVERSSNGNSFQKVGTVTARDGSNNQYSFVDTKPSGTVNFYRLKQVDKNGSATYSKVILIRSDLDKIGAKVSPNPFHNAVNVSFQLAKTENIIIRLYNQTGQMVKQVTTRANAGINTINISELSTLPAGNYTLELRGETITARQQVVKQ